jgi:hypothetical protein
VANSGVPESSVGKYSHPIVVELAAAAPRLFAEPVDTLQLLQLLQLQTTTDSGSDDSKRLHSAPGFEAYSERTGTLVVPVLESRFHTRMAVSHGFEAQYASRLPSETTTCRLK